MTYEKYYDDDEWSLIDDEDSSFCIISAPPSVCSVSDSYYESESESEVVEIQSIQTKADFAWPGVKRKSKFRYKPRPKVQPNQTFSLAQISQIENELFEQFEEDKSLLLTLLATKNEFITSLGKVDLRLWKFLKSNLVSRLVEELLPADNALLLWCHFPVEQRQKWLDDKTIQKIILPVLKVDFGVSIQSLVNIQTEEELQILTQESQKPWKRAVILGNIRRDGYLDDQPCGWNCDVCTFRNPITELEACQMCGTKNDYPMLAPPQKLSEWNPLMDIDISLLGSESR